jgi:hypothetical protein
MQKQKNLIKIKKKDIKMLESYVLVKVVFKREETTPKIRKVLKYIQDKGFFIDFEKELRKLLEKCNDYEINYIHKLYSLIVEIVESKCLNELQISKENKIEIKYIYGLKNVKSK